jgi:hypothetical protein
MQYWWKQDWTMLCCPRCSLLSTILNNVVAPDSGSTILFNIVDKCEQRGQQIAKTLFNPVEQRALRFLPCRLFYLYNNCDITFVNVFIVSHPVNFFCGFFQQSVDRLFSHESVLSHESVYYTRQEKIRLLQYWSKQGWTMFWCPHCSQLSTIFNNNVTPDSGSTVVFNIVDKWTTWAAKHCSILLSSRFGVFCRVCSPVIYMLVIIVGPKIHIKFTIEISISKTP